ncbi:MAG: hypothetical protein WCP01_01220 [Methylococcaceae bacterium]|jgi:hypothetical protein
MKDNVYRKALKEYIGDEGDFQFELAPLSSFPQDMPVAWKEFLSADDPVKGILEKLWYPWRDLLPQTIAELEQKLRFIGLLQTQEIPFSLIYGFECDDGESTFNRGFPCRLIEREEAKVLTPDFLNIYKIHNGWTDIHGFAGPMRSEEWFDLTAIFDGVYSDAIPGVRLEDFLVICDSGGTGYLGYDLSKSPPVGLECFFNEPVEVVPDVVRALDELMAVQLHDLT